MSGHSKWNNIKNKKEKTDAQKAKIFTKIGKEIAICVRDGGGDPNTNGKLRDLIAKAKANNVPNDNIERAIKKATGADAVQYEEITYEGYGPSGVAVIVEAATDSRNRTASDVRHFFDKYGGNLRSNGCVSYMFEDKGIIILLREDNEGVDEDKLMEDALEAGQKTSPPMRIPSKSPPNLPMYTPSRKHWNPLATRSNLQKKTRSPTPM